MAHIDGVVLPFTAGADLSGKYGYFVRMTADKTVGLHTATGQVPAGVLENKPTAGQGADVKVSGRAKVVVHEPIAYGQQVAPYSDGTARVAASGDYVGGYAISTSAVIATTPMIDIVVTLGGAPLP